MRDISKLRKHIENLSKKKGRNKKQSKTLIARMIDTPEVSLLSKIKICKQRISKWEKRQQQIPNQSRAEQIVREKADLAALHNLVSLKVPGDPILNFNPKNPNVTESAFTRRATSLGWAVIKRGFPDYICWQGKQVIFVEVKPEGDELSIYQQMVMQLLLSLGLECFKWTPLKGLQKLKFDENLLGTLQKKLQLLSTDEVGRYALLNNISATSEPTIQTQPDAGSGDSGAIVHDAHLTADC
jgi:hypothetical protein